MSGVFEAKFTISGLDDLQKELSKRTDLTPFKTALKTNTALLQRDTQRTVPIDTGTLMRSIMMRISADGMTGTVVPEAEYAGYVEYGTRFMDAQPYLRPTFDKYAQKFISDLNRLL